MNRQTIEKKIRTILDRVTEEDAFQVGRDEDLSVVLGLDSLGRLEVLSEVEELFDVTIYDLDTETLSTIRGMVRVVEDALSEEV